MGILSFFKRTFRLSDTVIGGGGGDSSIDIGAMSAEKALQISTVWNCVRLISETVGTLPLGLYRRVGEQGKEAARNSALYTVLHDSPNADFTAVEYLERLTADLCLWGNHYAEITRRENRQVVALTGLDPSLVSVGRTTKGGVLYTYADPYRGWREISEESILQIRGFAKTNDDLQGLSPIGCARVSLDIASAADNAAAQMYRNGMRPSGVLSTDRVLRADQRKEERDWVSRSVGGVKNAGGLLVLEGGYKYSQISMSPADAQFLENRVHSVEDICRWFRVPPFLAGHTQNNTSWGTGLEQQSLSFLTYTLRPYLSRIEKAMMKKLLLPSQRQDHLIEFNLEGLLRADTQARSTFFSTALQNGWMSRNEVRAKENMGPVDGGDILTVQTNLTRLSQIGIPTKETQNGT